MDDLMFRIILPALFFNIDADASAIYHEMLYFTGKVSKLFSCEATCIILYFPLGGKTV